MTAWKACKYYFKRTVKDMKKIDPEEITNCPRCPNHCSLDALGCKKGDKFLEKLNKQKQGGSTKEKRGIFGRKNK